MRIFQRESEFLLRVTISYSVEFIGGKYMKFPNYGI